MNECAPIAHERDLDALRGLAIFGVVLTHVTSSLALTGMFPPLIHVDLTQIFVTGGLGVQLFFLLSGYLLTITESRRRATGAAHLGAYVRRRFLRLAPAYYLSLAVYLLMALQAGTYRPWLNTGLDLLAYLSFLHQLTFSGSTINAPYWSLTSEVVFYAALPWILRRVPAMRDRATLYAATLVLATGTYYAQARASGTDLGWYLLFHPAAHLHLFLAGMLLAGVSERRVHPVRGARRAVAGDLALLLALTTLIFNAYLRAPTPTLAVVSRLVGETMVAGALAAYVLGSPLLRIALRAPGLASLGRISYSVFLFQGVSLAALDRLGFVEALRTRATDGAPHLLLLAVYLAAVLAITIPLSTLTYRWIEVPGMRGFHRPRARVAVG